MRPQFKILIVLVIASCIVGMLSDSANAQHLRTMHEDASTRGGGGGGSSSSYSPPSSSRDNQRSSSPSDGVDLTAFDKLILMMFLTPISVANNIVSGVKEADSSPDEQRRFADYPYQGSLEGGYIKPISESMFGEEGRLKWYGGRLSADYGVVEGGLERIGGDLLFTTNRRLGLDAEGHWYHEIFGDEDEELALGDVNALYRWAESGEGVFISHVGLGMNWMDYDHHTDFGFNFTITADLFLAKPWCWSNSIDWGNVGHAELFRYRTTLGFTRKRFEPFIGYEYLDFDRSHLNQFLAGIRIWY